MVTKAFNVRTGIKTGNISLNAATDSINAASIFSSVSITTANLIATTKVSAVELATQSVSSNLIPKTNAAYDLGSVAKKFNDLYLANTVNIGTQTISANATGINFSGEITASSANIDSLVADSATITSLNTDTATVNTQLVINSTIDATSTDTGSIITAGGVGIAKDLYIGGAIHLANGLGGTSSRGIINYNDGVESIDFNFNG